MRCRKAPSVRIRWSKSKYIFIMDIGKTEPVQPLKPPIMPSRRARIYPPMEVPDDYRIMTEKKALQFPEVGENDFRVKITVSIVSREGVEYEDTVDFSMPDAKLPSGVNFALRTLKSRITDWWKRIEIKMITRLIKDAEKKDIKKIEDEKPNPNESLDHLITEEELAKFDYEAPSLQDIPDDLKKIQLEGNEPLSTESQS